MEIRRGKSGREITTTKNQRDVVVNTRNETPQIYDVKPAPTKTEKTIGFLESIGKGFQRFANWAGETRGGGRDFDDVFLPPTFNNNNDDMLNIGNFDDSIQPKQKKPNTKKRKSARRTTIIIKE